MQILQKTAETFAKKLFGTPNLAFELVSFDGTILVIRSEQKKDSYFLQVTLNFQTFNFSVNTLMLRYDSYLKVNRTIMLSYGNVKEAFEFLEKYKIK